MIFVAYKVAWRNVVKYADLSARVKKDKKSKRAFQYKLGNFRKR